MKHLVILTVLLLSSCASIQERCEEDDMYKKFGGLGQCMQALAAQEQAEAAQYNMVTQSIQQNQQKAPAVQKVQICDSYGTCY